MIPATTEILRPPWPDVPAHTFRCQNRVETCAEKVRAMVEPDLARDLYDLALRLEQGYRAPAELVAKKLGWSGGKPRVIEPHSRTDYERDLRNWLPHRAALPWEEAWRRAEPYLDGLPAVKRG